MSGYQHPQLQYNCESLKLNSLKNKNKNNLDSADMTEYFWPLG